MGALDALTRLHLQDELQRIVRHEGTSAVLVTHDVDEAAGSTDRCNTLSELLRSGAHRRLSQFRHQAVERDALR
ncbi:MAG: hypothetical protein EOS07_31615 [Mesorhizobium sp.]|nr:MAG: hypothetical protein EOS07_31615 [Mesorhizobium sp.]